MQKAMNRDYPVFLLAVIWVMQAGMTAERLSYATLLWDSRVRQTLAGRADHWSSSKEIHMDARFLDRLIMIDGTAIVLTATVVSMIDTRYGVIPALIAVGVAMMMVMHREMAAKLRLERPEPMLVNCSIEQARTAISEALGAGDCRPLDWKVCDSQEQRRLLKAEYRWDELYLVAHTGTSSSSPSNCNIRL